MEEENKEDKVVAYLDGEDAFPVTEKEMNKWIKKFLSAEDKNAKGKGGSYLFLQRQRPIPLVKSNCP